ATTGGWSSGLLVAGSQLAQHNSQPVATDGPVGAEDVEDEPDAVEPGNKVEAYNPDVTGAQDDLADIYDDGCFTSESSSDIESCVYGDKGSDYEVAVVGDSHAAHWIPALENLAGENGWK